MNLLLIILFILIYIQVSHTLSYTIMKKRILNRQTWDLNICCGKINGGGINADIRRHASLANMVLVDVYHLPFRNQQFQTVMCSHTIEHVHDPQSFFKELNRVGKEVTLVIPPLWDISAALNIFEHKYIFLSWRKEHKKLPPYVPLPLSTWIQKKIGQKIKA